MRWNCPHCTTALAVSDDKLSEGWSFSRCYQCKGFSLVRRSDAHSIKVNKEPSLGKFVDAQSAEKPLIVRASPRSAASTSPRLSHELSLPEPLPETPIEGASVSRRIVPLGIALAGVLAIGSGIYLYVQGQSIWQKARTAAQQGPAPITASLATLGSPSKTSAAPVAPVALARAQAPAPKNASAATFTDRVSQKAMAPERARPRNLDLPDTALVVRARLKNATLRSGPGLEFSVVGQADAGTRYFVADWRDRWFKVVLPESGATRTAWIRNDLVELISGANPNL